MSEDHNPAGAASPLIFAIPLVARGLCEDWELVQENLHRTVRSIQHGTSHHYRIVIACNELPDLGDIDPGKMNVLLVPFPPQSDINQRGEDKARKRRFIATWIRETVDQSGYYVMLLDADDLVSRELVQYVTTHDNRRSYIVDKGYIYDCTTKLLRRQDSEFAHLCGSCFIAYFEKKEMPSSFDDVGSAFSRFGVDPSPHKGMVGHKQYAQLAGELGKRPDVLPFHAVVYLANHPESLRLRRLGRRRLSVLRGIVSPWQARSILTDGFAAPELALSAFRLQAMAMFALGIAAAFLETLV